MGWLPPDQYVRTLPSATMYAALYFTDAAGDPFLLRSAQGPETWQFPGGNVEHGDATPFATAVRECREETGIVFEGPPVLLLTHFLPPRPAWPCAKVGLVFDGGTLTPGVLDGVVLDPAEHTEWHVRPRAAWEAELSPRLRARLVALAEARRTGAAAYLCEPEPLA
ncbi:NUDIX domain-containing protein [Actinomadura macrotermitis]|uniref:Nudix hydrolase domain-containing protein n=1 Tax=Actinomadura macrotermitis TaxID=2585200 RepID=A0A7K0C4H9_9ACTN|nr:NUDIX hydrolase [Actinomadura macrotermitis]MQY08318.1 hypothetical protein [Actinomadura macrotermitis]